MQKLYTLILAAREEELKSHITTRLDSIVDDSNSFVLDTEIVDKCIISLKSGKAPDYNGLMAEHFQFAHPCLTVIVSRLFKMILLYRVVPDGFGCGLSHPIPKSANKTVSATVDDFRTITVCPIILKIFEHCVLYKIEPLLKSSARQFGFKKGSGCGHATHILKETVDYFTSRELNVCVGVLYLSKAFDRVTHSVLFSDLLNRGVPTCIVYILIDWYDKTSTPVLWNDFLSLPVLLKSGVRQGRILSPLFLPFMSRVCLKLLNRVI